MFIYTYIYVYMFIYTFIQEISWLFSHSKRQAPPAFLTLRWGDVLPNKHKVSQQILKSPLYKDLYNIVLLFERIFHRTTNAAGKAGRTTGSSCK